MTTATDSDSLVMAEDGPSARSREIEWRWPAAVPFIGRVLPAGEPFEFQGGGTRHRSRLWAMRSGSR